MCLQHDITEKMKHEIMKITKTLIKQNHFHFFKLQFTYKNKDLGRTNFWNIPKIYWKYKDIRHFIKTPHNWIFPLCW
jgi:hypothetical protein